MITIYSVEIPFYAKDDEATVANLLYLSAKADGYELASNPMVRIVADPLTSRDSKKAYVECEVTKA